ncbi:hypothetical protein [Echinicola sp. 20G]|uniref:hypothetical protein n=1 Tax=Echinicola sp. 20G TaxID=2781961 RepID=UPI00191090B5|nr:hypothetical protein [Echinicola sp. 20G]
MKKLALVFALSIFAFAGAQASTSIENTVITQSVLDRVEIKPMDLPEDVKDTILESEETKSSPISKAYEVTDTKGKVHYEVTFGIEEEAITKKYDFKGNDITEDEVATKRLFLK